MPSSLDAWNEHLRWQWQRAYETEMQERADGACSYRRWDGRPCDREPGHGRWHTFHDMCEHCSYKISAPAFAIGEICQACGKIGRAA